MTMLKRLVVLVTLATICGASEARALPVFQNPSFEAGLDSWITTDISDALAPLAAVSDGAGTDPSRFPWGSLATDGNLSAFSGWDGVGPGTISLAQDVLIPVGITVMYFDYRAGWDLNFGANQDRQFNVRVQTPGDVPTPITLGLFNILTAPAGTYWGDTGYPGHASVNLSDFSGLPVRVIFELTVPESHTGPSQFTLDNITIGTSSTAVPDDASTFLLLFLGIAVVAAVRLLGSGRRFRFAGNRA